MTDFSFNNGFQVIMLSLLFFVSSCFQAESVKLEPINIDIKLEYQAQNTSFEAKAIADIGTDFNRRPLFLGKKIFLDGKLMTKEYTTGKGVFYHLKEHAAPNKNYPFYFENYQQERIDLDIPFYPLHIKALSGKKRFPKGKDIILQVDIPNLQEEEKLFVAFIYKGKLSAPKAIKEQEGIVSLPTNDLPKGNYQAFLYRVNQIQKTEKLLQIKAQTKAVSTLFSFQIF